MEQIPTIQFHNLSFVLITDLTQTFNYLYQVGLPPQFLVVNTACKSLLFNHSRQKDYSYVGIDEHGQISSKGLLNRNTATGNCITSLNDSYLLFFNQLDTTNDFVSMVDSGKINLINLLKKLS